MRQTRSGFTLIELLLAIAIITALAGILLPIIKSVKTTARRATSVSNLRQCGVALLMYCDDYGGLDAMPSGAVASQILRNAPTCDPGDTWRKSCREDFGPPLIGSYAYVRYVDPYSSSSVWSTYVKAKQNSTLLASIYYASRVPSPFHGDVPADFGQKSDQYPMPDRVLRLRLDGSVGMTTQKTVIPGGKLSITWGTLFLADDPNVDWVVME